MIVTVFQAKTFFSKPFLTVTDGFGCTTNGGVYALLIVTSTLSVGRVGGD